MSWAKNERVREGNYVLPDGRKVDFTDADTLRLASDLYQFVDHDYKGSPSVEAIRLEAIIKDIHSGKGLDQDEWNILHDLMRRYGSQLDAWRKAGRDGQDAVVPEGPGRIREALASLSPDLLARIREGYQTESTTAQDRNITAPHLLDSALHDLAHAKQHADRLLSPDVRDSKDSIDFNVEHMTRHLASARDHASRLGKHLETNPSDPTTFKGERALLAKLREVEATLSPGQSRQLREAKAPPPPNLREGDPTTTPSHQCGSCRMFYAGQCWGYGNMAVQRTWVCDSWQLDPTRIYDLVEVAAKPLTKTTTQPRSPTICVDFDGVIHQGQHGLPGKVEGSVIDGALAGLKDLSQRFRVVVLTARVDLNAVRDWLGANNMAQYIDEVTNRKPPASAYIDDRATHFTDWPAALQAVDPDVPIMERPKVVSPGRYKQTADDSAA